MQNRLKHSDNIDSKFKNEKSVLKCWTKASDSSYLNNDLYHFETLCPLRFVIEDLQKKDWKKNKEAFSQLSKYARHHSSHINERRTDVLKAVLHHVDHYSVVTRHAILALKDMIIGFEEFFNEEWKQIFASLISYCGTASSKTAQDMVIEIMKLIIDKISYQKSALILTAISGKLNHKKSKELVVKLLKTVVVEHGSHNILNENKMKSDMVETATGLPPVPSESLRLKHKKSKELVAKSLKKVVIQHEPHILNENKMESDIVETATELLTFPSESLRKEKNVLKYWAEASDSSYLNNDLYELENLCPLQSVIEDLRENDWKKNKEAFSQLSKYTRHHSSQINELRTDVLNAVLHHADHYSVVNRQAIPSLKDMIISLEKFSDEEWKRIFSTLISYYGTVLSKGMQDMVKEIMKLIIPKISYQKSALILTAISGKLKHKKSKELGAKLLKKIVIELGPDNILNDIKIGSSIINTAAGMLMIPSESSRYYGRKIFLLLMVSEAFGEFLNKYVSANLRQTAKDTINAIRLKGVEKKFKKSKARNTFEEPILVD